MPPGKCCPVFECSEYCAPFSCAIYCCIFLSYKNLMGEMQIICIIILGLVVNECFKATSLQSYKAEVFNAFLLLKTYTSFFLLYRTRLCSQRNLLCSKYPELLTTKIHLHRVHSAVFLRHLSWSIFCRKAWDNLSEIVNNVLTLSVHAQAFSALLSTTAEFYSKIDITKPETLLK